MTGNQLKTYTWCAIIGGVILYGIFRPPDLNSANPDERIRAVNQVTDQTKLAQLAVASGDSKVEAAAVARITDRSTLAALVEGKVSGTPYGASEEIQKAALEKISDPEVLADIAIEGNAVAGDAAKRVSDQALLLKIALESHHDDSLSAAIGKLTSQDDLAKVALQGTSPWTQQQAIIRITDQALLSKIALTGSDEARADAVAKVSDPAVLTKVALEDKDLNARQKAIVKLTDVAVLLKLALEDDAERIRQSALETLGQLGDKSVIGPLSLALPYWGSNGDIIRALGRLGWQPSTEADQVYGWIGNRDRQNLTTQGDETKRVLFADLQSTDRRKIENAVYTFISLGQPEKISDLIQILNASGTPEMAETFLNCGNPDLDSAAKDWAQRNGYQISKTTSDDGHQANWGGWK